MLYRTSWIWNIQAAYELFSRAFIVPNSDNFVISISANDDQGSFISTCFER